MNNPEVNDSVSYTQPRAHENKAKFVCRRQREKKKHQNTTKPTLTQPKATYYYHISHCS